MYHVSTSHGSGSCTYRACPACGRCHCPGSQADHAIKKAWKRAKEIAKAVVKNVVHMVKEIKKQIVAAVEWVKKTVMEIVNWIKKVPRCFRGPGTPIGVPDVSPPPSPSTASPIAPHVSPTRVI